MNNISTVLPMISFEFDPGATAQPSEPLDSSPENFASMLASMWCAPAAPQPLNQEISADSESLKPSAPAVTDYLSNQTDQPIDPFTGEVMTPQPILTFEGAPTVVESTPSDLVNKKTALPDVSLPEPTKEKAEGLTRYVPIVVDQPIVASNVQPNVRQQVGPVGQGFVRPPLDANPSDPLTPKVNVPTRRPPTFIDQQSTSTSNDFNIPEVSVEEIRVTADKSTTHMDSVSPAPPDQFTAEAIKREANLVASYLAQSTRDNRESAFEAIKTQVSGNGAESNSSESNDRDTKDSTLNSMNLGSLNFASNLKAQSAETVKEIVSPQVANQIAELASTTQPRQQRSVRLRLRPEELGQVDIQLSRDSAGKVSAHVVVEREAARTALAQSLPQLRAALERAGLSVDSLNVSSDTSSFSGTSRDHSQSTDESHRSSSSNQSSTNTSETQSKERVREHKLLSLSA